MTIEECRARDCEHVSQKQRRRNCGVVDCSRYDDYYKKRWAEEEDWEFENCEDEEIIDEKQVEINASILGWQIGMRELVNDFQFYSDIEKLESFVVIAKEIKAKMIEQ